MGTLTTFLSEQTIRQIGWVLVHFLWQGFTVMALLWCVLKILGKASSHIRYLIACGGLALMVLAPLITFAMVTNNPAPAAETAAIKPLEASSNHTPAHHQNIVISYSEPTVPKKSLWETFIARLEASLPCCVMGWIIGVAALSLWYLGGWCQLQRLRRIGTKTIPERIRETASQIAGQLGVRKAVQIVESAWVEVPTVIGWLKPVVLLPASALTGLDELQLKAMIAHELAHIKRCDYLVNIVQTIVEILGFYHPAVWWAGRQIRIEREHCCDDIAISLVQNRKQYAGALFTMEAIRTKQHDLAVAANGGHLTNRISRLAGTPDNPQKSGWIPSVITMMLISALIITSAIAMSNKTDKTLADMMDKQKITAFLKEFEQAVKNGDLQAIQQYLYFENDVIRQKAQPYIQDTLYDEFKAFSDFHIVQVDQPAPDRLEVFGLFPVEDQMYAQGNLSLRIVDRKYRFDLFNERFFENMEMAKTQTPRQIGLAAMQKQLDQWQNADSEELTRLIQTLIDQQERYLTASQYARANNLKVLPHLTEQEIQKQLDKLKNTPPEQLRREIVAECTSALNNSNENSSASKLAVDTTTTSPQVQRLRAAEKLNNLGVQLLAWAIERDDIFPKSIEQLQLKDSALKQWAIHNVEYLGTDLRADIANPDKIVIAYDKGLLETQEGTNVLFADHHVEFRQKDKNGVFVLNSDNTKQSWEQAFYALYRLTDGEILKRIAPPFIPERKEYYYSEHASQAQAIPEPPDYFTFHWDGKLENWGLGFMSGNNTLDSVIRSSLSIPADRFQGPDELLNFPVPGDWIVRTNLSEEQKLKALQDILRMELGQNIQFERQTVRQDVIVAKGAYRFTPPAGTYDDRQVHFYADRLDPDEGSGGGTADTVAELIAVLGERTGIPVIDETTNSSQTINQPYGHHRSSRLRNITDENEKHTKLNQMLRNLEQQTNLTFAVEERPVEKWFISGDISKVRPTGGMMGGMGMGGMGMGGGMGGGMMGGMGTGGYEAAEPIHYPQNWVEHSVQPKIDPATDSAQKLLSQKIDFSPLTRESTLEEAIELIRRSASPPLPIIVLWNDLSENAFIEPDTPIGVDGLGIMKLEIGLRAILRSLSSGGLAVLDFIVEDGVITIATKDSLPEPFTTKIYDISDLLIPSSGPVNNQTDLKTQITAAAETIVKEIKAIEPSNWLEHGGKGHINILTMGKLAVRQSPLMHDEVMNFLMEKRQIFQRQVAVEAKYLLTTDKLMEDLARSDIPDDFMKKLSAAGFGDSVLHQEGPAILDDLQATYLMKAAQTSDSVKILAAPKVMVLDNETATVAIKTDTILNTDGKETEPQTGINLTVTPHISPTGNIRVEIEYEYTYLTNDKGDVSTTMQTTAATLPDGSTMILSPLQIAKEGEPVQYLFCMIKLKKVDPQEAPPHGMGIGGMGGDGMMGGMGGFGGGMMGGTRPQPEETKD